MSKELTDEEYEELEEKASRTDVAEKEKIDLLKEKEDLLKEKEELSESANPNWAKFRAKEAKLLKNLEDAGIKVDKETGELAGEAKMSYEEVDKRAREATRQEALAIRKEELLGEIEDDGERQVVEKMFDKLTAGEDVNLKNVGSHFRSALNAAGLGGGNRIMDTIAGSRGEGPRRVEKKIEVLDDNTADDLAGQMGIGIKVEKK